MCVCVSFPGFIQKVWDNLQNCATILIYWLLTSDILLSSSNYNCEDVLLSGVDSLSQSKHLDNKIK